MKLVMQMALIAPGEIVCIAVTFSVLLAASDVI